jgi:hypothetical protein
MAELAQYMIRSGSHQMEKTNKSFPHVPAAFINAIADEGTKAEAVDWLQKTWNERCALAAQVRKLQERLEITQAHDGNGNVVPFPEGAPDGISARDATIELLVEQNEKLKQLAINARRLAGFRLEDVMKLEQSLATAQEELKECRQMCDCER